MHRLKIGRAADKLALLAARLFKQHRQGLADRGTIGVILLLQQQCLQAPAAVRVLTLSAICFARGGGGRAGTRANI